MLGIHDYWLFLASVVLLTLTPGQDTLYILGRSLAGGPRVGVASALGVIAGCGIHTLAAATGLSVLLAASPLAFTAVKLCGAAYLVFLGARLLLGRRPGNEALSSGGSPTGRDASAFRQGVLTNVLNPKVALFFLALLPQFIRPESSTRTLAFLALGATVIACGSLWCLTVALAAGRLRGVLVQNQGARKTIARATGALFVLLGARLAWSR